MFGSLLQLLGLSRWYHHEQHADRSNARKASGQSAFLKDYVSWHSGYLYSAYS